MKKLFLALTLFTGIAFSQQTVSNFTCRYIGPAVTSGTTTYYWVQAIYAIGRSPISASCSVSLPASLGPSAISYVQLNWTAPLGTLFDVMKTTTSSTPSGACNCALAVNWDNGAFTDAGATSLTYTTSAAGIYSANTVVNGTVPGIAGTGGFSAVVAPIGGTTSGDFQATSSASGTVTLTFPYAAPNGWFCNATDITTNAGTIVQSGGTTTTAVFTTGASVVNADHVRYRCNAF